MKWFRFRWIFCQLETLRRCFPSSIRQILDELPTTLDGTYERTLLEIPEEKWKHAHRLLQCLAVSSRPLRVEELAEILSIQFDTGTTHGLIRGWRPENREDAVWSACSSLIAIVKIEGSPVVQFSHFSVKEFLTSNRLATAQMGNLSRYHIALEPAHEILLQACLSTLLELDEHIDKKGLKDYPLSFYAAQYWFEHARFGDVSFWFEEMMGRLFDPGKPYFSAWIWLWLYKGIGRQTQSLKYLAEHPSEPHATPLYYSAACGLRSVTERLLSLHLNDVNPQEDHLSVPLWAAIENGHVDIASLLLQHGANPNYVCDPDLGHWTLLHFASCHGFSKIIQLLFDHGADLNLRDDDQGSPLQLASMGGHVGAIQLLLEYGADVNHPESIFGWTPLIRAAQNGRVEVARFLLQHNADVDGKDKGGSTALHCASYKGSLEMVQALLEWGADVHARNSLDVTPFETALRYGYRDIEQLLLEYGARAEENVPTIMSTS